MGITFKQLYNKLIGAVDVIPNSFAKDAINQALRHIYDERDWGFLWRNGILRTPAAIDGTAAVTKYSKIVPISDDVRVQIDAIDIGDIPLEDRQIRFFGTKKVSTLRLYNIADYDSVNGIITLDQDYLDDDSDEVKIRIQKVYYTAPTIVSDGVEEVDFKSFGYIHSHLLNKNINLETTLDELDQIDLNRSRLSANARPAYFVPYGINEAGDMTYEFYPHPTQEAVYPVRYLSNGRKLIRDSDTVFAPVLSEELILCKAKQKAYEWCIANAQQKQLKATANFYNMIAMLDNPNNSSGYPKLLQAAIKKDEDLFPQAYLGQYTYYDCVDYFAGYDPCLPHDRFGDTLVIDAAAPTIDIEI